jgi:iron complex outermembrane recepter protein
LQSGTLTNDEGHFSIQISPADTSIHFSFIGFETKVVQLKSIDVKMPLLVELTQLPLLLEEILVFSDRARERHSPVSFSSVESSRIQAELGDRPFPEVLQRTPGLFASRDGGGSGDATVSIRGFQQENIAVLLNGVPINGAENGLVYWNNWLGLTEATASIQVQRGIGASKVALNSVGGTINIITNTTETKPGGSLSHNFTDYGNQRSTMAYNTGMLENGWALSLLGSRTRGEGYINGTYVDAWAYYVGLSRQFGSDHKVVFTALGGPERHGQRNLRLSQAEIDRYGYKYNKEWGSYNGKMNNASENFYHKPHLAINHYWGITNKSVLSSSVYFTPGHGGGKWNDSFRFGPGVFDFRNPSGQIDWHSIYDYNSSHNEQYVLNTGDTVTGFSRVVQTHFLASHVWAGALTSYELSLSPSLKVITGLHYRYFKSKLRQKVVDLLGGEFYIDDYSWSMIGIAGRDEIKMPGDIIRINNGALLHTTSLFAQVEKSVGMMNAFVGGSLSDNRYRRHDVYNYPTR